MFDKADFLGPTGITGSFCIVLGLAVLSKVPISNLIQLNVASDDPISLASITIILFGMMLLWVRIRDLNLIHGEMQKGRDLDRDILYELGSLLRSRRALRKDHDGPSGEMIIKSAEIFRDRVDHLLSKKMSQGLRRYVIEIQSAVQEIPDDV